MKFAYRHIDPQQAMILDSLMAGRAGSGGLSFRKDSSPSIFFDRQLEQIKSQTYDILYPDYMARQFVPSSPQPVPNGADTFTYRQWDMFGAWSVITGLESGLKRADVSAAEFTGKVRRIGDAFGWSLDDMERAMFAGIALSSEKARASQDAGLIAPGPNSRPDPAEKSAETRGKRAVRGEDER